MFRRIIISKGIEYEILIDDDIYYEFEFKALHLKTYKGTKPYVQFKNNRRNVKLHRYILGITDKNISVDHINGNTLDNRRENLRICNHSENMCNTSSRKNSSSKYIGVSWNSTLQYWVAEVRYNKKRVYCGYFKDEITAAKARDKEALKYHGEFVKLNFNGNENET